MAASVISWVARAPQSVHFSGWADEDVAACCGCGGGAHVGVGYGVAAAQAFGERADVDEAGEAAVAGSFEFAVPGGGWEPELYVDLGVGGGGEG